MQIFNKLFLLSIILFNMSLFAQDGNPEDLLKKANTYYANLSYNEALENYSTVLHKGLVNAELYYNLGNTYYRLGNIGHAILNYEKALKLDPSDEDIKYNLKIANAHTADKIEQLPKLFFIEWWDSIVMSLTIGQWGAFLIMVYILFISLIAVYYYYRNSNLQKPLFFIGLSNVIILIFITMFFINRISYETKNEYGILLESSANVKVSPDYNGNDAFIIHEGIKFIIEDKVNNWSKIKLNDGKVGWLNNNAFKTI